MLERAGRIKENSFKGSPGQKKLRFDGSEIYSDWAADYRYCPADHTNRSGECFKQATGYFNWNFLFPGRTNLSYSIKCLPFWSNATLLYWHDSTKKA